MFKHIYFVNKKKLIYHDVQEKGYDWKKILDQEQANSIMHEH